LSFLEVRCPEFIYRYKDISHAVLLATTKIQGIGLKKRKNGEIFIGLLPAYFALF